MTRIVWVVEARADGRQLHLATVDATRPYPSGASLSALMWRELRETRARAARAGGVVNVYLRIEGQRAEDGSVGPLIHGPWSATYTYPKAAVRRLQQLRAEVAA